mmetsp:Transcript_82028/g.227463  ORF Transcript_82028/g.227463 Transcript_82028/m.227463 type:complete len:393 (+) Transcript_82028:450-1628(+)
MRHASGHGHRARRVLLQPHGVCAHHRWQLPPHHLGVRPGEQEAPADAGKPRAAEAHHDEHPDQPGRFLRLLRHLHGRHPGGAAGHRALQVPLPEEVLLARRHLHGHAALRRHPGRHGRRDHRADREGEPQDPAPVPGAGWSHVHGAHQGRHPLLLRHHPGQHVLGRHGHPDRGAEEHVPPRAHQPGGVPHGLLRGVRHVLDHRHPRVERADAPGAAPHPGAEHGVLLPGLHAGREVHRFRLVRRQGPLLPAAERQAPVRHQRRPQERRHGHGDLERLRAHHHWRHGGRGARLADRPADADHGRFPQGAQGPRLVHQGPRGRLPGCVRLLRRLLHRLGPDHEDPVPLPLRVHHVQEPRLPPRRVAAADHGQRPQDRVLGHLRRAGHPCARGLR